VTRQAAIAGVAESDLGVTGKSVYELQAQAISAALGDAGLDWKDVDGRATTGSSAMAAVQVAEYLGLQPRWLDSTNTGGSSFEVFTGHALAAIQAGLCDVAVISYASNQRSARSRQPAGREQATPSAEYEGPYGLFNPISSYALAAQRYMHEFGATPEQLAEVAVSTREWALKNPKAFTYGKGSLTIADVLASPMVSTPLHVLDCCLITDGGGALVIVAEERARDLRSTPVRIIGQGEHSTHQGIASMPDLTATGGSVSARMAYDRAGLELADIDVVQIYDSFTITVLLTLEALGACARGDAAGFVEGGRLGPGGDFPINTSGGGLSYCHPGMYGIFLLIEAVRQLRGECRDRQLARHETALCHGTGGVLSSHSTVILCR
jgi:acetyl-CoA acetyltransferase